MSAMVWTSLSVTQRLLSATRWAHRIQACLGSLFSVVAYPGAPEDLLRPRFDTSDFYDKIGFV